VLEPDAYLRGTWSVSRTLADAALGAGDFAGTATFTAAGGGLAWEERGRLRVGAYDGPARRTLRVVADGSGWTVRFADGRRFHPLDLSGGTCAVRHPCAEDLYEGEYAVLAADAFHVRWRVRGPAKAQEIESRYRRVRPR
jgi:hypothetical protein